MKNERRIGLVLVAGLLCLCWACKSPAEREVALYEGRCGGCHAAPAPEELWKSIWSERILPDMGARMGIATEGYDPYGELSWMEKSLVQQSGVYPETPTISPKDWVAITAYIMERAPDTLASIPAREHPHSSLSLFQAEPIQLDRRDGGHTSYIGFSESRQTFLVGNISGELIALGDERRDTLARANSPIVDWQAFPGGGIVVDIGILPPSERSGGGIRMVNQEGKYTLFAKDLHRPVYALQTDLDQNGQEDLFVCEYGHHTGRLSHFVLDGKPPYVGRTLLDLPGTLRVLTQDMNGDGLMDLVVLCAQGNEGVYILYQEPNMDFRIEQVIRLSPVWGTSWMEMVDIDGDGDQDLILVQGDNADYSAGLKPYHGVRIYTNDGSNQFEESYFYPLHGATRVIARDFDQDGDIDLAVCAYFPAFDKTPEEAFVYFENRSSATLAFVTHTFPQAIDGRWIVAEAGDFDGDGDLDLLLGSFTHTPASTPESVVRHWNERGADLMLLRNQLRSHSPAQK